MKTDLVIVNDCLGVIVEESKPFPFDSIKVKTFYDGIVCAYDKCNVKYVDIPIIEKKQDENL